MLAPLEVMQSLRALIFSATAVFIEQMKRDVQYKLCSFVIQVSTGK